MLSINLNIALWLHWETKDILYFTMAYNACENENENAIKNRCCPHTSGNSTTFLMLGDVDIIYGRISHKSICGKLQDSFQEKLFNFTLDIKI